MLASTTVDSDAEEFSSLTSADVPAPDVLARAVRQRRAELRLSQEDIRRASGLSVTTIGKIERGDPDDVVQRVTMRRLDLALRWPVGTCESWYDGRGGIVAVADLPDGDLGPLLDQLAPLIAERLGAATSDTVSVAGLPPAIVTALRRLIAAVVAELGSA